MRRLLTLGQPHRNTAIQAYVQSRRPLALVVALVLCHLAFVFSSTEAWAKEPPSSAEQQQPMGESKTIVNGKQVAEPARTSPPVGITPPNETSPTGTLPSLPPSDSVQPEAEPQPAPQPTPLQRAVVITTTGGEAVGPGAEPTPASWQSEPTPTESAPITTTATWPTEPEPAPASAAHTPDLGSPETAIPAAAEEVPVEAVPATLSAGLWVPSEVSEPPTPDPALQQVAQGVGSQEQARPAGYSLSGVAPTSAAVRPLTNFVGTSTETVVNAAANVLGTVGGWLADEAPSGGEDSSSSSGGTTTPEPVSPVIPEPLRSSFISLFSGGGQTSAGGGAGATSLLAVLFLGSLLLLRRDFRMYLVSCEVPKPSSALLSPLERPG